MIIPAVRGLLIAGATLTADPLRAAVAAVAAARRAGDTPTVVAPFALGPRDAEALATLGDPPAQRLGAASPMVAAAHAGRRLDPAELVTELREAGGDGAFLVAAVPGGPLAPLTPRYAVRDLARELGLPVVLAVRAEPGMPGLARLALEALRGAGIAVVAVVLTSWPDPPDRVLLDERAALAELAGAPIHPLPERGDPGEAARDWPVADWAAAAVPEATEAARPTEVVLEEYEAWEPRAVGDPRSTPRPQIMATMLEIIGAEGPMTAARAYSQYNRAAGGRKLTSVARAPLSSAVYWLATERKIVLTREADIPWQGDDLVRLPDAPPVRVRKLGPRTLEEVPLDEVAELIRRLRAARSLPEATDVKRAVLATYGLVRLTTRADEYLTLAIDLADETE